MTAQLLVEAYVRPGSNAQELQPLGAALHSVLPAVAGVVVFPASSIEDESRHRAPLTSAHPEAATAIGGNSLMYHAVGQQYRVSGGSFFQTNRYLVDTLAQVVTANAGGCAALDLTRVSACLRCHLLGKFDQVLAVESSQNLVRRSAPQRSQQREVHSCDHRASFLAERGPEAGTRPRRSRSTAGRAGRKTAAALGRMSVSRVTYVSCDPATLSRDLRLLLESGFRVEQAHLVDMFPQTFHMETVLHLVR